MINDRKNVTYQDQKEFEKKLIKPLNIKHLELTGSKTTEVEPYKPHMTDKYL